MDKNLIKDLKEPLLPIESETQTSTQNFNPPRKLSFIEKLFKKVPLVFALFAGLSFALNNFLTDYSVQQVQNLSATFITGFPFVVFTIIFHGVKAISLYSRKGVFHCKEESPYYRNGKFDWYILKILVIRAAFSMVGIFIYIWIQLLAFRAGVNSSTIISIFSAATVVTAILFHFVFNEKLFLKHYIGMMIITVGVIFIANEDSAVLSSIDETTTATTIASSDQSSISVLIPVIVAVLNTALIACSTLFVRFAKQRGFPIIQFTFDCNIVPSFIMVILFLYYHFNVEAFNFSESMPIMTGQCFMVLGVFCVNGAMAFGKGGPVQAFVQSQSPFQLMLEILVFQRIPNIFGLVGMACSIAGVLTILLMK